MAPNDTCSHVLVSRTNLAFAALTLNEDLHFTASEYGIASGVFFLSYAIFQASRVAASCGSCGPCGLRHIDRGACDLPAT